MADPSESYLTVSKMAPTSEIRLSEPLFHVLARRSNATFGDWRMDAPPESLILESWSEGVMVGALMIMACITIANMRRGVILHKLILTELLLAISHGTFCFMNFHGYGWYLSSTASILYCSYVLHNFIAWIKIQPFFVGQGCFFQPRIGKWVQRIYLTTLIMSMPPIILQIFDNFRYFNNISLLYKRVRPYEPLMRDPWWVFTNIVLLHIIRKSYGTGILELIRQSPRLGILLAAICLALIFTIIDFSTSIVARMSLTDGINPYWKLSLVFKCLTDSIMLDDFKTELRKLNFARLQRDEAQRNGSAIVHKGSFVGGQQEIEYAGYINGSPDSIDLGEMLTSDEQYEAQREARRRSSKLVLGRMGKKISHLPTLSHDGYQRSLDQE